MIEAGKAYTLREFSLITGLGRAAVLAAEDKGLVTRFVGRHKMILGEDFLEFLKNSKADPREATAGKEG